jgi:hypothetical protein
MEKGTTRSPQPQNYMLPKVHVIHNSDEMAETSQAFHHFFFPGLHVFRGSQISRNTEMEK